MQPDVVVVTHRDRMRQELALRLGQQAVVRQLWDLSDLFALSRPPAMAIVDVLELFPIRDRRGVSLSSPPTLPLLVVGSRLDSDAILPVLNEGIPVQVLEDLVGSTLVQMVAAPAQSADLYLQVARLSAERVWSYLQRSSVEPLLTRREAEVLELVAEGHSNRKIGRALRIELKTVKNHLTRIYEKLGVTSRCQAASRASTLSFRDARLRREF